MTFSDTGSLDNDVVHLHLEHRVVTRLLTRFRTQGFVHDDLSRACVVMRVPDPIPRVLLLARLSLFGEGASRLHEEILTVAARVEDGFSKVKVLPTAEKTNRCASLPKRCATSSREASPALSQNLRKVATSHLAELLQLERRGATIGEGERQRKSCTEASRPRRPRTWKS